LIELHGRLVRIDLLDVTGPPSRAARSTARDTKLNRDVALKVLPAAVALDPDRVARFRREAQVPATLNHPNIAASYGLEESGDIRALKCILSSGSERPG
jgi:serine/threonine-protein kinase